MFNITSKRIAYSTRWRRFYYITYNNPMITNIIPPIRAMWIELVPFGSERRFERERWNRTRWFAFAFEGLCEPNAWFAFAFVQTRTGQNAFEPKSNAERLDLGVNIERVNYISTSPQSWRSSYSSTDSERVFSFAKLICTDHRSSIDSENFEAIQFLRSGFASGLISTNEMIDLRARHSFANDWRETSPPANKYS